MRLHKKEIAKRQIETALELFFEQKDFLSVITLAGASEEILGSLLRRVGERSMMDHLIELDKHLKHANNPAEDELEVDPEHAVAMLARAVANYTSLASDVTPAMYRLYEHLMLLHPEGGA